MSEAVINSSGNVFIDIEYSPDEAAILQMRADLLADLRKVIKAKRLTQTKAPEILGISQSFRLDQRQIGKIYPRNAYHPCDESGHAWHYQKGGIGTG